MAQPLGDIMSKVLHPWVKGKRPPISGAVAVVEIPFTSKKESVLLADMEQLRRCALLVGQRKLTAPE